MWNSVVLLAASFGRLPAKVGPALLRLMVRLVPALLVLAVGMGVRTVAPGPVADRGGLALYAVMVWMFTAAVLPRLSRLTVSGIAAACCAAVEFFQLTGIPAQLAAGSRLLRWALGTTFDVTDLRWYGVGVISAHLGWRLGCAAARQAGAAARRITVAVAVAVAVAVMAAVFASAPELLAPQWMWPGGGREQTGSRLKPGVTASTVAALQAQVGQHGNDTLIVLGGLTPVPDMVHVGAVDCEDTSMQRTPGDGAYQVTGFWLAPLPSGMHTSARRALEEHWTAKGYAIRQVELAEGRGVVVVVTGTDTVTGYTVTVALHNDPSVGSVKVTVNSPCVWPADRRFPQP